jgi:septal ring factor EnvC (AmiA/AmiB activator)
MKKMGTRPGKRIFFQNSDGTEEKQKILQSYLQDMKVKQMDKLEQKKAKLADEIKDIEENNKKLHEMKLKEKNKKFQKEAQFRQQVEEVKKERQLNDKMDEDYRRAGLGEHYFPFTHGD